MSRRIGKKLHRVLHPAHSKADSGELAAMYLTGDGRNVTSEMKNAIHAQGAEPQAMTPEKRSTPLQKNYSSMRDTVKQAGVTIE